MVSDKRLENAVISVSLQSVPKTVMLSTLLDSILVLLNKQSTSFSKPSSDAQAQNVGQND